MDGTHEIAVADLPDGTRRCVHQDVVAAADTICRIREMEKSHGFHVALAHDTTWMTAEVKDEVLFSMLDENFRKHIDLHIAKDEPF